jgi:hypothetical protein
MQSTVLKDKIAEYFTHYMNGEMTYKEFQRFEKEIQAQCKHEHIGTFTDENDNYVWCHDCGDDL